MNKKYKNKIKAALSVALSVLILSSCTDWLQVDPIDKVGEKTVFKSEATIQQALNGLYIQMGKNDLYGRNLSMTTLELIGQQYAQTGNTETGASKYYMINRDYETSSAKSTFLSIWTEAYSTLLNINNFIENLNETENIVVPSRKDILLGEAYGLRAYIHLDLLRMFGPVYLIDSTGISIPYRDEAKIEYSERILATEVMDKIMRDLDTSLDLLKNDPVRIEGVMAMPSDSLSETQSQIDEFYRYRNRRMNYYAVGALKVRALMYRNCKEAAAQLARTLLEPSEIPAKFPWAVGADVLLNEKQDRIFSKEVLFGVHSSDMYSSWNNMFSPGITNLGILYCTGRSRLETLYEVPAGQFPYCTDWRAYNWATYSGDADYMITNKLARSNKVTDFWYFQPLIRKTELYYALAECESNVNYLEMVRMNRNVQRITELRPEYNLEEEIQNEFLKEMHNEGQIFFFYKRKARQYIPIASSGNLYTEMSVADYEIPIPQSELDK